MPLPDLPAALLLPVLAGLALAWPQAADAQIRRCTAPDGTSVFTDRRCEEVGSVARRPDTGSATSSASGAYRPRCMRSVDDLVFEMTMAFDSQDANRLAGLYHWTGMSSGTAYATVDRLDRMVQRPLVGIVPVMPPDPESRLSAIPAAGTPAPPSDRELPRWQTWTRPIEPDPADTLAEAIIDDDDKTSPATGATEEPATEALPRRRPVALRIEQTGTNDAHATSTVFGLTRHFGCWWISG